MGNLVYVESGDVRVEVSMPNNGGLKEGDIFFVTSKNRDSKFRFSMDVKRELIDMQSKGSNRQPVKDAWNLYK